MHARRRDQRWAEEMRDRDTRQLRAYRLARDARALAGMVSKALTEAGIEHAVTGAAAAARLAPFVTAIPVTEVGARAPTFSSSRPRSAPRR